ncbi:hypothetical protein D7X25_37405 [bacterium 1XD42-8]|nr:hypothetical protein D7X25_37405 [bacterium 1XD42-8]
MKAVNETTTLWTEAEVEELEQREEYITCLCSWRIYIDDGKNYLQNCDKKYDLVIIDVYQNISIPVNFTSTEFFSLCNKVLKDDGIIAMNIGLGNSTDSKLVQCLGQTLKRNVQNVYAYKTPIDNNVLIIGGISISDLHQFNKIIREELHIEFVGNE